MAVLRRRGMVAWMRAWDGLPATPSPSPALSVPPGGEPLVAVLASMALACVAGG